MTVVQLEKLTDLPKTPMLGMVCQPSVEAAIMDYKAIHGKEPEHVYVFTSPTLKHTTIYIPKPGEH